MDTWQQRIRHLIAQHPDWKDGKIAKAAKVPVAWVGEVRREDEAAERLKEFYARKAAERLLAPDPEPKPVDMPTVHLETHGRKGWRIT